MRFVEILFVLALLVAACGDDTGSDASAEPGTASGATTTSADAGGSGGAAGSVTIGAETWEFDPTIQCRVTESQTHIAGVAVSDPTVSIVFDYVEGGVQALSVSGEEFQWFSDSLEAVEIAGDSVGGAAVMGRPTGTGDLEDATFEFSC